MTRIDGVADRTGGPLVRSTYAMTRRRMEGRVAEPIRVFAHHQKLMMGYGVMELATERSHRVDERLKILGEIKAAMLAGCEWCLDFASDLARKSGLTDEQLQALPRYRESGCFDALQCLVLDYAVGISSTPVAVSDELFAELREHFDEGQLVELTSVIALENYRARFNWAFGIGSDGFSDGAFCVRPE